MSHLPPPAAPTLEATLVFAVHGAEEEVPGGLAVQLHVEVEVVVGREGNHWKGRAGHREGAEGGEGEVKLGREASRVSAQTTTRWSIPCRGITFRGASPGG